MKQLQELGSYIQESPPLGTTIHDQIYDNTIQQVKANFSIHAMLQELGSYIQESPPLVTTIHDQIYDNTIQQVKANFSTCSMLQELVISRNHHPLVRQYTSIYTTILYGNILVYVGRRSCIDLTENVFVFAK